MEQGNVRFEDGLIESDPTKKDGGNAAWARPKALICSFPGVAVLALLCIVALRIADRRLHSLYDPPVHWQFCTDVFVQGSDYWDSGSPCQGAENAMCTYAGNKMYSYCYRHYYKSNENSNGDSWEWSQMGTKGTLVSIWEDSKDCDTLGLSGWEETCMETGMAEEDLENTICALNQYYGYVSCGGTVSFRYQDGSYTPEDVRVR